MMSDNVVYNMEDCPSSNFKLTYPDLNLTLKKILKNSSKKAFYIFMKWSNTKKLNISYFTF